MINRTLKINIFVILFLVLVFVLVSNHKNNKNVFRKNNYFKKQLENFVNEMEIEENYIINDERINNTKVAIVSMVTKQPDFEYWLYYHLNVLKLDHIFLRVEDSPEYQELFEKYPNKITATFHNKEDIDMKHNYLTIMDRQRENVNSGINKALLKDIDYIFHSDADELIYVNGNKNEKAYNLRKFLLEVPVEYKNIHLKNFEAVFPNNEDKCFNTNKFIDCKKGQCLSYANGKSCGRVSDNLRFRGPHNFTGETLNIDDSKLAILHFDSCTYKQWENKFDLLKDTNEEKMKKIPFPFYKNSIRKLQKCGGDKKKESNCKSELNEYYNSQKIAPYNNKTTNNFDH